LLQCVFVLLRPARVLLALDTTILIRIFDDVTKIRLVALVMLCWVLEEGVVSREIEFTPLQ
jgi:hypothetical protein